MLNVIITTRMFALEVYVQRGKKKANNIDRSSGFGRQSSSDKPSTSRETTLMKIIMNH